MAGFGFLVFREERRPFAGAGKKSEPRHFGRRGL
jgi:hypothetical protein